MVQWGRRDVELRYAENCDLTTYVVKRKLTGEMYVVNGAYFVHL